MSEPQPHSLVVVRQVKKSEADKEPIHKVVLKTTPSDPFQAKLEITSELATIFQLYPLNETIEMHLKSVQKKLG